MIDDVILHQATRRQLQLFLARPTHALLLTGPAGIGKTVVAEALAAELLAAKLDSYPYYLAVRPEGLSISIDTIRRLQKFLQLKTVGDRPIRRVIVIEHAHKLTTEAQNAFLKLLEEPPADTVIILTAHAVHGLLPTIVSRVQMATVHPPSEEQLQPLLQASNKDQKTRQQAWFLSSGLPGLLHALLYEEEHPLLASVAMAKDLLQKPTFERLAAVDPLNKQKDTALGVVEALERIAQAGIAGAGTRGDTARIRQWHTVRTQSHKARQALQASANTKLVLTNLFLTI